MEVLNVHKEMIKNLINAPINLFHDTTPKGQIFNRLSKDLPTVDTYTMFLQFFVHFQHLNLFLPYFFSFLLLVFIHVSTCILVNYMINILFWYSL